MTSRQAVQVAVTVALAIVVGRELSAARYYWAVIAAFVMFTGTSTRSETFLKAANRVIGTFAGLWASILMARVTAGHSWLILTVIVASMFCGFYLIRVSYAYMIFFITIVIGQLYTILNQFSDELLMMRLGETIVGAACGIVVSLLVTPLSTRDTVRSARTAYLEALADVLDGVADWLTGEANPDLDALSRGLDNHARRLMLVAKPLTRPLVWGNRSPRTRHRLRLFLVTSTQGRSLIVGVRNRQPDNPDAIADACRQLARAARAPSHDERLEMLKHVDEQLVELGPSHSHPALRMLRRMHDVLVELSQRHARQMVEP